jgi:Tfp pilus assembly protein PilN
MTSKQTSYILFGFAMVVSFIFLSVLIRVNYDLDQARRANDDLQKQINQIKKTDDELHQKIVELTKSTQTIAHDIDVTQELQRKQAQVVVDLKKSKKK